MNRPSHRAKASAGLRQCLAAGAVALLSGAAAASIDPPALCETAAREASQSTGVPLKVLETIALAESGRTHGGVRRPWPWAVNFGGPGFWYDSIEEAQLAVAERQALGTTNFDVGCFQINHRWHGEAFESVGQMFDPRANALYAARFLQQLYAETGDWPEAVGAYHSRTPALAEAYRARYLALQGDADSPAAEATRVAFRANLFPLLKAGTRGSMASLVPMQARGASLFGSGP